METSEITRLPLETIHPNSYNPNILPDVLFEQLLKDIRENGFIDPIIVRETGEKQYEIIDGEHRYRAAKQLGFETIPVFFYKADDTKARILTYRWNHERGFFEPAKTAKLIQDLETRLGSLDRVRDSLGMVTEEMVQFIKPKDIPASWQMPTPEPVISETDKEALVFFLPLKEKETVLNSLSQYAHRNHLKDRNTALYQLCNGVHSKSESRKGKTGTGGNPLRTRIQRAQHSRKPQSKPGNHQQRPEAYPRGKREMV